MLEQGVEALQEMVKSWQSERIFLWTLRPLSLSLSNGTASYSLSADPAVIGIDQAYFRENNQDTPIEVASFRKYQDIPEKTQPGKPILIAIDNRSAPTAYVWPVPNATMTIYYLGICKVEDWEDSSGSEDWPVRWQNALTYGLAADLADEYLSSVTQKQYLTGKAKELFTVAARSDVDKEDVTFVEPAYPVRRC